MKDSYTSEDQKKHLEFGKRILSVVPHLHPYVKHRLYTAETSKIVPKNMYKTTGIIDDAILSIYEEYGEDITDPTDLKLKLFKAVNDQLDTLFKNEEWHLNTLSTSNILSKELDQLVEKYKLDVDEDLIMDEELDDISYHQNNMHEESFIYDDAEENIMKALEFHDIREDMNIQKRNKINKVYTWLPHEISNIIDLYVFGKLNYQEISIIKEIDASEVKKTITSVRKSFRKNL